MIPDLNRNRRMEVCIWIACAAMTLMVAFSLLVSCTAINDIGRMADSVICGNGKVYQSGACVVKPRKRNW